MNETYKNAVDYLYEWAEEQGKWAVLLVNKIVSNYALVQDDYNKIIDLLIKEEPYDKLVAEPNVSSNKLPKIRLKKLYNIKGVNKLAGIVLSSGVKFVVQTWQ